MNDLRRQKATLKKSTGWLDTEIDRARDCLKSGHAIRTWTNYKFNIRLAKTGKGVWEREWGTRMLGCTATHPPLTMSQMCALGFRSYQVWDVLVDQGPWVSNQGRSPTARGHRMTCDSKYSLPESLSGVDFAVRVDALTRWLRQSHTLSMGISGYLTDGIRNWGTSDGHIGACPERPSWWMRGHHVPVTTSS
jgi:hypothetical protein